MRPQIPAGIAAGILSTLLLAALAAGSLLAVPLFLAAPLPIAIAGFAFGSLSAAVGAVTVGIASAFFASPSSAIAAFLLIGLPIATIVHFFSLSRTTGEEGATEWYPLGPILLRVAGIAAAGTVIAGIAIGFDGPTLSADLRDGLAALLDEAGMAAAPADVAGFADVIVNFLPVTTAGFAVAMAVANAFLGASIAAGMKYVVRPRPAAWTARLPLAASAVFVVAAVVATVPGSVGDAASAVAGAFGAALALIGLAVIHALTLRSPGRPAILFLAYVSVPLFGIPVLLYAALGILDALVQLRPQQNPAAPLNRT